jgi:hypothetical protein
MEQLLVTKGNVNLLFAADEAIQGQVDGLAAQAISMQGALNSTNQALAALTVEADGKQSQLRAGTVEGGHPLLTFSYEDQGGELVGSDTIRALKVSAPLLATQESQHLHLSLDASLATQSALDKVAAQATPRRER